MKFPKGVFKEFLKFNQHPSIPHLIDVELAKLKELEPYKSSEIHLVLYPYSREICAKDFTFNPFEEYVSDIISHQKSAYLKVRNYHDNLFGLFLGMILFALFFLLKPQDLFSVESIVSILGIYLVGKDLWCDIEYFLISMTKNWRIRYVDRYYDYYLDRESTLSRFASFAKKNADMEEPRCFHKKWVLFTKVIPRPFGLDFLGRT